MVTTAPVADWQSPKLAAPKPVLAAAPDGSFGFGKQLVLQSQTLLPRADRVDAFEAAASLGTTTAVVSSPTGPRGSTQFSVGQATLGHLFHTGSPDVDVWKADNLQPDLSDVVQAYRDLGALHFAPNVAGIVNGSAAYLPVLEHGTVAAAPETDVIAGLTNLGSDLYAKAGLPSASLEQALTAAKLLSTQAGQAFAVTATEPGSDAGGFLVSPLMELTSRDLPTRSPIPRIEHSIEAFALEPGGRLTSSFLHGPVHQSLLAIVDGAKLAVPRNAHAAVGVVGAGG